MRIIYLCSIFLSYLTVIVPALAQQKFAIEPEDISAVIGETILLPCRVVNKQGVLQWTKDDFGLGAHRNLSAFERYAMIGHDENGDFSLQIENVTLEDDARFQCQVSPGPNGQPGIRSRFATVTILIPSQPPTITQGDFLLATESQDILLECVSKGGKPEPELTWVDGSGNIITNGIEFISQPMSDSKRSSVRSILKLSPQRHHHNTTFSCQSHNLADRNFKIAEIKLEVKYAPKITLFLDSNEDQDEDTILENSEARFRCIADGNPTEISYKWFINNELIIGDYTTEMVIHKVNRTHHKAIIKCEATNDIGVTAASMPLNIKYPPIFKYLPSSVDADEKEDITLSCAADGNPVEIVWVHDPIDRLNFHPRVVGTINNLDIIVSNETAGRYFCKASVSGFPEIKAEAIVYMKQAPIIESPRIQYGSKGDTLRLECSAFSVPKARHISWSFNGHEINPSSDLDYSILDDPSPRRIKSTLIIQDSQDWHFGKYNCTVVNDYGVDVLQIELMQQNNFQFLMIIVGATSSVVILVIIVVLFLCIKLKGKTDNRTKKEKEFSADIIPNKTIINDQCCREGDESSHSSEYKPDIKAGSSESDYSIASTNFVESTIDAQEVRGGSVPLAGPVDFPNHYRNSADYADANRYYPPKYSYGNYGYETHTDYARYCLAPSSQQKYASRVPLPLSSPTAENYHFSRNDTTLGANGHGMGYGVTAAGGGGIAGVGNGVASNGGSIGSVSGGGKSGDSIVILRQENGLPAGTRSSLIV